MVRLILDSSMGSYPVLIGTGLNRELRAALQAKGYEFLSQTDTEVIAHLVDSLYNGDLFDAVKAAIAGIVKEEGAALLGWRDVPTDNSSLGKSAVEAEPHMAQVFIARGNGVKDDVRDRNGACPAPGEQSFGSSTFIGGFGSSSFSALARAGECVCAGLRKKFYKSAAINSAIITA